MASNDNKNDNNNNYNNEQLLDIASKVISIMNTKKAANNKALIDKKAILDHIKNNNVVIRNKKEFIGGLAKETAVPKGQLSSIYHKIIKSMSDSIHSNDENENENQLKYHNNDNNDNNDKNNKIITNQSETKQNEPKQGMNYLYLALASNMNY